MDDQRSFAGRLFRGWPALFLIIWLLDLVVLPLHEPAFAFSWAAYAASIVLTLIFALILEISKRLLPNGWRQVYVLLVSLVLAFVIAASIGVYRQFGEYVTVSTMQFALHNPIYLTTFIRSALFNIAGVGLLVLWLLIAWLWSPRQKHRDPGSLMLKLIGLALLGALYLAILNQLHWYSKGHRLTADTSFALALKRSISPNAGGLHATNRKPVSQFVTDDSLNVILIINVSFGKKAFDFRDSASVAMPFLRHWIANESDHFISFDYAHTNATATDVSVPSLLTGVAPWESGHKLHTMPMVWDWVQAAHLHTLFVSAQLYNWGNFDSFLLSPGPDQFLTPDVMGAPLTNDVGVDELVAMRRFCSELQRVPSNSHFLAVYNSNSLHWPFQQTSPLLASEPHFASRYQNAAAILDEAFHELHSFLDSTGLLENTLLIITSDHGEDDKLEHSKVHRLYGFYDEITNIPFLIRIPRTWATSHSEEMASLSENEKRLVSNLDVVPTILDALGCYADTSNRSLLSALSGQSLLQPVPADRYLIALSTNDIRQWEHEGFGIYRHNLRFVYSDLQGARLFDVASDPHQQVDLWPAASDSMRQPFLNIVDSTFHLRRMLPRQ
jgi:phosphoglycerol transferase MdoB-like AlkP superfamily enzyme